MSKFSSNLYVLNIYILFIIKIEDEECKSCSFHYKEKCLLPMAKSHRKGQKVVSNTN